TPMPSERLTPPLWDHQRHVLASLREQLLRSLAGIDHANAGDVVVDLGCGDQPYRRLIEARGFKYVACDLEGPPDIVIRLDALVGVRTIVMQQTEDALERDAVVDDIAGLYVVVARRSIHDHGTGPHDV